MTSTLYMFYLNPVFLPSPSKLNRRLSFLVSLSLRIRGEPSIRPRVVDPPPITYPCKIRSLRLTRSTKTLLSFFKLYVIYIPPPPYFAPPS